MWQVLVGIYIVVILVTVVFIWSALVLAKKADQNTISRDQVMYTRNKNHSKEDQAIEIPPVKELSEK